MYSLDNKNLVFVSYPPGAGGWFLCALIHYFYHTDAYVQFDNLGSGHANKHIRQFNDMYPEGMLTDIGQAITHGTSYDKWNEIERIEYIRTGKHPFPYENLIISVHSADLKTIYKAFESSKFIKINITESDIRTCRYNFLYKRMTQYPEFMEGLAKEYGKNPKTEMAKLFPLNKENLDSFSWADNEITKFNNVDFDNTANNVLNITYTDLLKQPEEEFLDNILEFLDMYLDQHTYENSIDALIRYRLTQPKVPE